ncbi:response regulator [candidate division KSB1 bacterium]|nr:response regulator [candidate division KSB1 bacterium]NIR73463.1 response regulator [candidate division KSB1 bacterium]NIS27078.1 response regulator [candidate division KSB1 bacterium]NIT73922.1 response regulator [candidate division KSB1 bacterium]NIU27823.1 response regulator [candidate division KSB1 bacterium]
MTNPCVLIAGPNLTTDLILMKQLGEDVTLLKTHDYSKVFSMLKEWSVDLLLLEVRDSKTTDISLVSKVKKTSPDLPIIVINGDDIAGAFAQGATDAFPKPYDRELLVERVLALLKQR